MAHAAAIQANLPALLTPLWAELSEIEQAFQTAGPNRRPTAAEREALVSSAQQASHEPLNEAQVRQHIDEMLTAARWQVHDGRGSQNLYAARGVAVREVATAAGRADYLMYVDTKLVGVIEAKREGADLAIAESQADRYAEGLTARQELQAWRTPLPYRYVSDGGVVRFRNEMDPESRTRDVFSFHQPETIARWMREAEADPQAPTYRARLRDRVPKLTRNEHTAG